MRPQYVVCAFCVESLTMLRTGARRRRWGTRTVYRNPSVTDINGLLNTGEYVKYLFKLTAEAVKELNRLGIICHDFVWAGPHKRAYFDLIRPHRLAQDQSLHTMNLV
jgi:hypothetical protein